MGKSKRYLSEQVIEHVDLSLSPRATKKRYLCVTMLFST